jgi:hypothetical protein
LVLTREVAVIYIRCSCGEWWGNDHYCADGVEASEDDVRWFRSMIGQYGTESVWMRWTIAKYGVKVYLS